MAVLIVASAEPGVGRSLIAAAIATKLAQDGRAVTLTRLTGDDSAPHDAEAFAALDDGVSPGRAVEASEVSKMVGDVVVEAPPGPAGPLAGQSNARFVTVAIPSSPSMHIPEKRFAGTIITRAPIADAAQIARGANVLAVLAEDPALAAPSIADIVRVLAARWLAEPDEVSAIDRVMIGTVASDAAGPYFANRQRTCVVTRFDKTDIQLAALNTDVGCMVLTGGGEPSPYLLDRLAGHRPDVAVLLTDGTTVEAVREIEPLYSTSRFAGQAKVDRAVELLDGVDVSALFG